jgi:hypothetical protein
MVGEAIGNYHLIEKIGSGEWARFIEPVTIDWTVMSP